MTLLEVEGMLEDQILSVAVEISTAIIGLFAGALVERMRHRDDIELMILRYRMQVNNEFIGLLRNTSISPVILPARMTA